MFRHQGPGRTDRQNGLLAAYLALTGGFVNSASFILVGTFTSHVTGNVGRLGNDVVWLDLPAAAAASTMILAFFAGAFVASMIVESSFFGRTPTAYGVAMLAEATLLAAFLGAAHLIDGAGPRTRDMLAVILCAAMGVQNSLVTRLSGAVVRTTHLTGVVTDLGIEAARWFRWWRGSLSEALRWKLSFGRNPPERPSPARARLLVTIVSTFTLGAVLGSAFSTWIGRDAMLLPCLGVLIGGLFALETGRRRGGSSSRPPAAT
jgi:uncharacterized membrane protein YoaK (UPF0700 family)